MYERNIMREIYMIYTTMRDVYDIHDSARYI